MQQPLGLTVTCHRQGVVQMIWAPRRDLQTHPDDELLRSGHRLPELIDGAAVHGAVFLDCRHPASFRLFDKTAPVPAPLSRSDRRDP